VGQDGVVDGFAVEVTVPHDLICINSDLF
jgi:hypothetical protein